MLIYIGTHQSQRKYKEKYLQGSYKFNSPLFGHFAPGVSEFPKFFRRAK
jgi:hypothetical protein